MLIKNLLVFTALWQKNQSQWLCWTNFTDKRLASQSAETSDLVRTEQYFDQFWNMPKHLIL